MSLLLDRLVRPGVIDLPTLVARLSPGPARLLNLPGGSLAPGAAGRHHHARPRAGVDGGPGARSSRGAATRPSRGFTGTRRAVDDDRRRRQGDAVTRPALLALADGRVFRGEALGAAGEAHGEVVFNTSMTGYQEILTDPSYRGQIGLHDLPAHRQLRHQPGGRRVAPARGSNGFIVKEACPFPSSWRSTIPLDDYLREHGIVGIQGIDTRALTRHLRDHGAQEGIISTERARRRAPRRAGPRPARAGRPRPGDRGERGRAPRLDRGPVGPRRAATPRPPTDAVQGRRLRLRDQAEHPRAAWPASAAT